MIFFLLKYNLIQIVRMFESLINSTMYLFLSRRFIVKSYRLHLENEEKINNAYLVLKLLKKKEFV